MTVGEAPGQMVMEPHCGPIANLAARAPADAA
ncbi:hypothetical protein QFZ55_000170 [Streptomyces luteogriseus]|nr:hypothetical protein [Streptomyces luteogriseus]